MTSSHDIITTVSLLFSFNVSNPNMRLYTWRLLDSGRMPHYFESGSSSCDSVCCMWCVCASRFSLRLCMLSYRLSVYLCPSLTPLPLLFLPLCLSSFPSLVNSMVCKRACDLNFNISVCRPTRLLRCCCPEILLFPPLDSHPVDFPPSSSSLSWLCNDTSESELHSVNRLNNLYEL